MIGKRRYRLQIINDILNAAKDGVNKTVLMHRANLSFTQLNGYLNDLLKSGLLGRYKDNDNNGRTVYRPSIKGVEYMQRFKDLVDFLKTSD